VVHPAREGCSVKSLALLGNFLDATFGNLCRYSTTELLISLYLFLFLLLVP